MRNVWTGLWHEIGVRSVRGIRALTLMFNEVAELLQSRSCHVNECSEKLSEPVWETDGVVERSKHYYRSEGRANVHWFNREDLTQPNYLSPDQTCHKWSLLAHEAHFKKRRAPKWVVCIRALHYIKWSISCSLKCANGVGKYSMMPSSPREGQEVSEPLGFWNKLSTHILFGLFFLFHHSYNIFNNCSKWLKNMPQCMG